MDDKKRKTTGGEPDPTPEVTRDFINVSGRMLSGPDGADWPSMGTRALTEQQSISYLAYGYAVAKPDAEGGDKK